MNCNIKWISTSQHKIWAEENEIKLTAEDANLEVTDNEYQTWYGFGGCFNELGWKSLGNIEKDQREELIKNLFESNYECQFNFCRLPIGANDYSESWYSYDEIDSDFELKNFSIERDKKKLIPYIKSALKYNPELNLFASPWSPPAWMKFPNANNYGTLIWERNYLQTYALYFKKFIEEYDKEGIKIDQVHIQNEPMSSQKFPSCVWTGEEMRDFIRDYLGPLFEKESIKTQIWLGTLNGPETDERKFRTTYNKYADLVLNDKQAKKYISGISYQWAGKYAIQRTHESWPEIPVFQSENECGDGCNTWEYACYVFDLIHHYINNGVIAYIYWNMVLNPGGESTWGWNQNSMITIDPETKVIIYNPEYYIMKHFSKFIKRGDKRIGLKKQWSGNSICFKNKNNYIIVIKNPFDENSKINIAIKNKVYEFNLSPHSFNSIIIEYK